MNKLSIFLDLDGVIANFTKAACQKLNIQYPAQTEFDGKNTFLPGSKSFWSACSGHNFWANMEKYPWADRLHAICKYYDPTFKYLTKPSEDAGAYSGKYEWIEKHYGDANQRLILTNVSKSVLVKNKNDILIDDNLKNIKEWKNAGGSAFTWMEVTDDWPETLINQRFVSLDAYLRVEQY